MADPTTYPNQTSFETRRQTAWSWLIPLLLIAAALAAYYTYANRNIASEQAAQITTTQQEQTQVQPVNKAEDLGTATAGTKAQLSNIAISQVVSNRIFTVRSGTSTIYTILSPNVTLPSQTTLQAGQQVAITGTLVSTNSDQFNSLNLSAGEKTALGNQQLVLLVDKVTISNTNTDNTNSGTNSSGSTNNNSGANQNMNQ